MRLSGNTDIASVAPSFAKDVVRIREMTSAGFVVGLQIKWAGPAHWHNEFDPEWAETYQKRNYFISDPIFYYARLYEGARRWSEVPFPDVGSVQKKGAKFGLNYGVIIPKKHQRVMSFLSVGKSEREFTDDEIDELSAMLDRWISELGSIEEVPEISLAVLRLMKQGMGQAAIAKELEIAESTVKQRVKKAMAILNAKTRTEAVAKAIQAGLLDTIDGG